MILFIAFLLAFPIGTSYMFSFIPRFIEHYENHYKNNHPLTFWEFIQEHTVSKEEHDKHERLPDGQENCPFNTAVPVIQLVFLLKKEPVFYLSTPELISENKAKVFSIYHFSFSEFTGSIWQPPKLA